MKDVVYPDGRLVHGDCLEVMRALPDASVDLIFGSPPYEDARLYLEDGSDLKIARDTEEWIAWMVQVFKESLRVCKGLVAFVVEGVTSDFSYSASPALLMADLKRAGITLRKPPVFARVGIPGSGGPDWLRNDYEFVVCAINGGKLPWSDNTACGGPCKFGPGGEISHRTKSGKRVNDKGGFEYKTGRRNKEGNRQKGKYTPPDIANPGNIIYCPVGGKLLGSNIAHENEAPFPEKLAAFFIRSFCPPGGTVYDPFGGSGTTVHEAVRYGRRFLASDLRASQVRLMKRRVEQARRKVGFGVIK